MKKQNQKGFTLIEVLLIFVILGIIAAIAIPILMANKAEAEAKVEATKNLEKVSALEKAIKEKTGEYLECPEYPENADSVDLWLGNEEFDKLGFSLAEEDNKSKLKYKITLTTDDGYVATATFKNGIDTISWYLTDKNNTVIRRVE